MIINKTEKNVTFIVCVCCQCEFALNRRDDRHHLLVLLLFDLHDHGIDHDLDHHHEHSFFSSDNLLRRDRHHYNSNTSSLSFLFHC